MSQRFNPLSGQFDLVLDKAEEIKYTPSGDLVSANVQDAIDEVEAQILALPDPITYKGTWSAATNTPTLSNTDVGANGFLYQVIAAGTVDFGAGPISFEIGDKVVNNGTIWDKWDMTDAVASVNGQTGIVVLDTDDIAEGSTNLYFTDERAQDAAGAMATSSAKVSLTYNDVANTLTPDIVAGSLVDADISDSAAIAYSKLNLANSIVNADVATAAAIARTKLASGSNNHVLINDGSGVMSSEAVLAVTRGGTGQSSYTDGQLLIGNTTGNTLTKATITAGSGITVTNGSGSITIAATAAAIVAPTVQKFTTGSGTYTTPTSPRVPTYIKVTVLGGGGGGGASGTASFGASSNGGDSSFGTSLITCTGGNGGGQSGMAAGGTQTVNAPAVLIGGLSGAAGQGASFTSTSTANIPGGGGGSNLFGASGAGGAYTMAGGNAGSASGAGGGGGGGAGFTSFFTGGGGGAGASAVAIITSPAASYSYVVGAGGNGGTAGTNGYAGGNGGSGWIIVEEYYQ